MLSFVLILSFSTHLCSRVTGEKAADFYAPLPVIMRDCIVSMMTVALFKG